MKRFTMLLIAIVAGIVIVGFLPGFLVDTSQEEARTWDSPFARPPLKAAGLPPMQGFHNWMFASDLYAAAQEKFYD